ncbi:lipase family protein [Renibacterium salmoninarum]|uniref:lipase family protein n=1 Tax=Renibacterium salmoninarum TaxID=1646 RepID=UPI00030E59D8|nr:lipase family protein [Renibacterium salmoninarum]
MSESRLGLDPLDAAKLAELLNQSSERLRQAGDGVAAVLRHALWHGPDSVRFRGRWPAHQSALQTVATGLSSAAEEVLKNIKEQVATSAVDRAEGQSPGFTGSMMTGTIITGAKTVNSSNVIQDGLSWVADQIRVKPISREADNAEQQLFHLGGVIGDMLSGRSATISELIAASTLAAGTLISGGISFATLGHLSPNWFADGKAQVGAPLTVSSGTELRNDRRPLTRPESIADIFQSVVSAYDAKNSPDAAAGDIRIVKIEHPEGSVGYTVNIPGTEDWGASGGSNGRDMTGNLKIISGQLSTGSEEVLLAMRKAGIRPDDPVMLVGHSQGGMIAGNLASDPAVLKQFNVTNLIAVGSPIDGINIDSRINVLSVVHRGDIVPKLDLAGIKTDGTLLLPRTNISSITMDDPALDPAALKQRTENGGALGGDGYLIENNHDFRLYRTDLAKVSQYLGILSYQNQSATQQFIAGKGDSVSAVDIPVQGAVHDNSPKADGRADHWSRRLAINFMLRCRTEARRCHHFSKYEGCAHQNHWRGRRSSQIRRFSGDGVHHARHGQHCLCRQSRGRPNLESGS